MKRNTICCIFNYAPHYREEIFTSIYKEFDCDFYFGDKTFMPINKIDYSKLGNNIRELKFKRLLGYYYLLIGEISLSFKDYKYYIITGQPYNISSWMLLLVNKIRRKKTYIWNHGWYGNEKKVVKILKKIQLRLSDGFLLYGNYAKSIMQNEGVNEQKLHVIYNSLSYSRQLKIREELKKTSVYQDYFENEYPTLIFIGRLTAIKKLNLLINAMKSSFQDKNYFNLVFIGTGIEKENLKKLVENLNLQSNVWFYGACYDESILGDLIYNAHVCVSPGNIGLTAIHSLTYGTPAITHNNFANQMPEFEAIQAGKTGLFFEEDDVDSLNLTIQNWLKKYPVKSNELIKNCFSIVDSCYNPEYQISLLKSILK